jgi:hypothetical protein
MAFDLLKKFHNLSGGEGGIRTHGPFQVICFQDKRTRPTMRPLPIHRLGEQVILELYLWRNTRVWNFAPSFRPLYTLMKNGTHLRGCVLFLQSLYLKMRQMGHYTEDLGLMNYIFYLIQYIVYIGVCFDIIIRGRSLSQYIIYILSTA